MYYFAYGSNMSFDHMRKICGWHFSAVGQATLENFVPGVDFRGYINIKEHKGGKVLGVLYNIDEKGLEALDEFEGVPDVFKRIEVEVLDESQEKYLAWVYLQSQEQFGGDYIREEYLNRVILGARENHLPEDWIEYLESFRANNGQEK